MSLEAKYIAGTKTEDESDISFLMSEDYTFILSCLTDSPDVKRIMKTYSHTLINGKIHLQKLRNVIQVPQLLTHSIES